MAHPELERLEEILAQLQDRAAELQVEGACVPSELETLQTECLRLWGVIEAFRLGRTEVVCEASGSVH